MVNSQRVLPVLRSSASTRQSWRQIYNLAPATAGDEWTGPGVVTSQHGCPVRTSKALIRKWPPMYMTSATITGTERVGVLRSTDQMTRPANGRGALATERLC